MTLARHAGSLCEVGRIAQTHARVNRASQAAPLYTPEQRRKRDSTRWTLVQGILAPVQFLAFVVSVALVARTLATGDGATVAAISVLVKTALLLTIMVTGAIWEKVVFGQYLFAKAFFWEDVFSMLVIGLHLAYVGALITGAVETRVQLLIALAAYAAYVVNAGQFLLKLRAARRQERAETMPLPAGSPA